MRRSLPSVGALAVAFLLAPPGCRTAAPAASADPAVSAVLAADAAAGRARNHAPETGPVAEAVRDYVAAMDAIELAATPPAFRVAFERHRDAWAALAPYLDRFPEERGEMHDVFDRLADPSRNPDAATFETLVAEVWATWDEVEASMP